MHYRPTAFLTILILLIACSVLINLGFWQLNRSALKTLWELKYAKRHQQTLSLSQFIAHQPTEDLRYYRFNAVGKFDNLHNILLDNKIVDHQIGYELYTPFYIFGSEKFILVDRGFIPQGASRKNLPDILPVFGKQTIQGILNTPPSKNLQLGAPEKFNGSFPWRVSVIDLNQISQVLKLPFYNDYILIQNSTHIPVIGMSPEKHIAYAVQWFMLAGTLVILSIFASRKKKSKK